MQKKDLYNKIPNHPSLFSNKNNSELENWEYKLFQLDLRWRHVSDSEGTRLVMEIMELYKARNPTLIALLKEDRVSYDKSLSDKHLLPFWFNVACIVGSVNMANHLLENYQFPFPENAVGYSVSCGDKRLLEFIALNAQAHGQRKAGQIYLYNLSHFDTEYLKKIESSFLHKPYEPRGRTNAR